jgi:asparagine synthase (glutamine-hydrolysing)
MCGIFGFVGNREAASLLDLEKAASMLRHRGPDGHGKYTGCSRRPEDEGLTCVLVHTRLAILDLSEAAHQPMTTPDGRYTLVYNGEVYNFADIRADLEKEGCTVHSTGDTEVVLKAFARWGAACVDRFRGMFAFAVWDRDEGRLFAARDRLGIKPLYYVDTPTGIAFASELRPLIAQGLTSRRISPRGLLGYLRFGSVQEPDTLVEGVHLLPAGHVLQFQSRELKLRRYWDFPPPTERKMTFDEAVEEIRPVLREAVKLRLVSDVPLGVFLSGGIDSSVITAIAASELHRPVHTFTVTFDEKAYSEETYAAEVAAAFECDHHQVHLSASQAAEEMDKVVESLDQPSADGINTYFVSKAAREAGLTVAISGLGADEVFAGYPAFHTFGSLRRLGRVGGHIPSGLLSGVENALLAFKASPRVSRIFALASSGEDPERTYGAVRCMFTDAQIADLLGSDALGAMPRGPEEGRPRKVPPDGTGCPVNLLTRLELTNYLRNTLLRDTDVMSMRHSLEVRVPFLDHLLVERMLLIPGRLKLHKKRKKPLLVDAAPQIPRDIGERPKIGFVLPLDHWFRTTLRKRLDEDFDLLSSEHFEWMNRESALRAWRAFLGQRGIVTASRIWCLVALTSWALRNGMDGPHITGSRN